MEQGQVDTVCSHLGWTTRSPYHSVFFPVAEMSTVYNNSHYTKINYSIKGGNVTITQVYIWYHHVPQIRHLEIGSLDTAHKPRTYTDGI